MLPLELADSWTAKLPSLWLADRRGDTVTAVDPDGVGALHITELRAKAPLREDQLREIALGRHGVDPSALYPCKWGDFEGLGMSSIRDQCYVLEFFLSRGRDLLVISYVCEPGDQKLEAASLDLILESLRSRPRDG
jgi:hypothetical protein